MSKINRLPVRRTAAGVLAGALALSGAVAAGTPAFAATGFALERVQGNDRYETSAAIAAAFGPATSIILASGESGRTPDALAASFLAGVRNAPVLLTRRDTTPEPILSRLAALRAAGTTRITVVGGPVAVSDLQITALRAQGFTVDRVAGNNRYETAAEIAEEGETGEAQEASNVGIIASGVSTIDALAGGPLAFKGRHPIFLVTRDGIPGATLAAIRSTGVTSVFILGGEAVVGPRVVAQLAAAGITVRERLAGANRSETSVAIANRLIADFGFSANTFNLASGINEGIDALGGAALSGKENRVILITNTANSAAPVVAFATARAATLNAPGRIFGGIAAITTGLEEQIETAAVGTNAGATARPELVGASIVGTVTTGQVTPTNPAGTTVRFTFDENVLETGAPPLEANFKIYNADGTEADSAATVVDVDGASVLVRFTGIATTAAADQLTVATVVPGAVRDVGGATNPEGDAAIGTTTAGGGATTLAAGITDGPDLVSVGGFRQAATANTTAVDFVFDEAAFVNDRAGFALITPGENAAEIRGAGPVEGSEPVSTTGQVSGGTVAGGNGTTTLTVIFPGTLTATGISRATVDRNTVSDVQQNATVGDVSGNSNPLQAVDVSNGGNTAEPDLVSATLRPSVDGSNGGVDAVVFTFDTAVTAAAFTAGTPDTAPAFQVYTDDGTVRTGTGRPTINTANATQVLVNFAGGVGRVVGASVTDGAVTSGVTATNVVADVNEQDEVGVTGTAVGGTDGRTRGRTAAPDLTSVTIARGPSTTDAFGNVTQGAFQATYTFDGDVDLVSETGFNLYLASATADALTSTDCAVGTGAAGPADDDNFDNTVVCTTFAGGTGTAAEQNAQLGSAVLGTVEEDAVNGQGAATVGNPEGAEITTGGTGTPAA